MKFISTSKNSTQNHPFENFHQFSICDNLNTERHQRIRDVVNILIDCYWISVGKKTGWQKVLHIECMIFTFLSYFALWQNSIKKRAVVQFSRLFVLSFAFRFSGLQKNPATKYKRNMLLPEWNWMHEAIRDNANVSFNGPNRVRAFRLILDNIFKHSLNDEWSKAIVLNFHASFHPYRSPTLGDRIPNYLLFELNALESIRFVSCTLE